MLLNMIRALNHLLTVSYVLLLDIVRFLSLSVRSSAALRAENPFLRSHLALYAERRLKARRANNGTRLVFVLLSRFFAWKDALVIVKPETLIRWHRKGSSFFWRWKTKKRGRPSLPVAVTANFRMLYVLVIVEIGTPRIIHFSVTDHPSSEWTLQQFREAIRGEEVMRFLIHDGDSIYSADLDLGIKSMGLKILNIPVRAPTAKGYCERLIGTIRRECLNFMIPLNERHLRRLVTEWVAHCNKGRPHSSLGPGIPVPSVVLLADGPSRHQIRRDHQVVATPVLGGLHHEYRLTKVAD